MKEGVEGEAWMWTASAGVDRVHGDGGGAFFGSRMEAASPAVPGQKEEGWSELVQRGVQQAENGKE